MTITSDTSAAIAELQAMAGRTANMQPFFAMLGRLQVEAAQTRITTTKTEPIGSPWLPWSAFTRKEREAKGNAARGLLFDTGTLLNSIHAKPTIYGVEIGTELDYAKDLQEGDLHMPAREFLGWTPGAIVESARLATLFIEKGILI